MNDKFMEILKQIKNSYTVHALMYLSMKIKEIETIDEEEEITIEDDIKFFEDNICFTENIINDLRKKQKQENKES